MREETQSIGVQDLGSSSAPIYKEALSIIKDKVSESGSRVVDIGGGKGNFSRILSHCGYHTTLLDFSPTLPSPASEIRASDLNRTWDAESQEFDIAVSLEVIEHLENPRHFFREIIRIVRPGGFILISTPNQISFSSKICFLMRDQHQHFQENSYPAHITPLLPVDFVRIAKENKQGNICMSVTGRGRIPFTKLSWQLLFPFLKGWRFSDNMFVHFHKT